MERKITKNNPFAVALRQFLGVDGKCTQSELGAAVGYVQASISALMLGKINGSEPKRRAIAEYFGYSYDEFLKIGQSIIDGTFSSIQVPLSQINITATLPEIITGDAPESCPQCGGDILDKKIRDHQELVGRFENKEKALRVNQLLIRLEQLEKDEGLDAAIDWAEYRVHQAEKKRGMTKANGTEGN